MTKQRVITAAILIPLFLGVLFFMQPQAFLYFTTFAILGAAWEWSSLMEMRSTLARVGYLLAMLLAMLVLMLLSGFYIIVPTLLAIATGWWLVALLLVCTYPKSAVIWGRGAFIRGIMGFCVLIPCWVAINYIRAHEYGVYKLLFLFVLIWGADSAAYFAGRAWGKHKLAPLVSPGKSVEGLAGALACTALIAMLVLVITQRPLTAWPSAIALSMVTVLFSVLGDLFESALKRQAGLKDSGKLLPGHGGLLDRIDSLTAAAPIFVFGALLLNIYLT